MPFCPKCRYEYEPGLMVCPDCAITLVDRLSEKAVIAQSPDDSWVVVGSVGSRTRSALAKGSLDSNNIPSIILPAELSGQDLAVMTSLGGQGAQNVIMVPKEFQEEARMILEVVFGDNPSQPEQR